MFCSNHRFDHAQVLFFQGSNNLQGSLRSTPGPKTSGAAVQTRLQEENLEQDQRPREQKDLRYHYLATTLEEHEIHGSDFHPEQHAQVMTALDILCVDV